MAMYRPTLLSPCLVCRTSSRDVYCGVAYRAVLILLLPKVGPYDQENNVYKIYSLEINNSNKSNPYGIKAPSTGGGNGPFGGNSGSVFTSPFKSTSSSSPGFFDLGPKARLYGPPSDAGSGSNDDNGNSNNNNDSNNNNNNVNNLAKPATITPSDPDSDIVVIPNGPEPSQQGQGQSQGGQGQQTAAATSNDDNSNNNNNININSNNNNDPNRYPTDPNQYPTDQNRHQNDRNGYDPNGGRNQPYPPADQHGFSNSRLNTPPPQQANQLLEGFSSFPSQSSIFNSPLGRPGRAAGSATSASRVKLGDIFFQGQDKNPAAGLLETGLFGSEDYQGNGQYDPYQEFLGADGEKEPEPTRSSNADYDYGGDRSANGNNDYYNDYNDDYSDAAGSESSSHRDYGDNGSDYSDNGGSYDSRGSRDTGGSYDSRVDRDNGGSHDSYDSGRGGDGGRHSTQYPRKGSDAGPPYDTYPSQENRDHPTDYSDSSNGGGDYPGDYNDYSSQDYPADYPSDGGRRNSDHRSTDYPAYGDYGEADYPADKSSDYPTSASSDYPTGSSRADEDTRSYGGSKHRPGSEREMLPVDPTGSDSYPSSSSRPSSYGIAAGEPTDGYNLPPPRREDNVGDRSYSYEPTDAPSSPNNRDPGYDRPSERDGYPGDANDRNYDHNYGNSNHNYDNNNHNYDNSHNNYDAPSDAESDPRLALPPRPSYQGDGNPSSALPLPRRPSQTPSPSSSSSSDSYGPSGQADLPSNSYGGELASVVDPADGDGPARTATKSPAPPSRTVFDSPQAVALPPELQGRR